MINSLGRRGRAKAIHSEIGTSTDGWHCDLNSIHFLLLRVI
jgi:hypothetical protein